MKQFLDAIRLAQHTLNEGAMIWGHGPSRRHNRGESFDFRLILGQGGHQVVSILLTA